MAILKKSLFWVLVLFLIAIILFADLRIAIIQSVEFILSRPLEKKELWDSWLQNRMPFLLFILFFFIDNLKERVLTDAKTKPSVLSCLLN